MALKPHYEAQVWETSYFLNETAERGVILCSSTGTNFTPGSGSAMDSFNQLANVAVNPSGRYAIGILWDTFVNQDLTEYPLNRFQPVQQKGNKATIIRQGTLVTNMVVGASSITPEQPAYLAATGYISPNSFAAGGSVQIGKFITRPDADGYVKVRVNL